LLIHLNFGGDTEQQLFLHVQNMSVILYCQMNIHLSIYISTYIAPLQGNYSEALPAQARPKRRINWF